MISYETTAETVFGDPEDLTVGELQPGDYVISLPSQSGYRGYNVRSAVKTADPGRGFYTRSRPRGPKFPCASTVLTFVTPADRLHVPNTFKVRVRRPVTP